MTGSDLVVMCNRRTVGTISLVGERLSFIYDPSWLADAEAFAISMSLPLASRRYEPDEAHSFFANLLPEGQVRIAIAQRLKLTEANDHAMLRALGGDCAGALSILPRSNFESASTPISDDYRPLPLALIGRVPDANSIYAEVVGEGQTRLSLAGAQDKLPVFVDHRGALFVPMGDAASNAILKFPSARFKSLPENEVLVSRLAAKLGLPSCTLTLVHGGGRHRCALVKRYDRFEAEDGRTMRLHQEDFCQALKVPPAKKYEQDGGPRFAEVFAIVQNHSTRAARDALALLRWTLFNILAGNADGHAKNLSLLLCPGSGIELAPFYDLVCTRAYEPRISRMGAMRIGSSFDPGQIDAQDWRDFAQSIGMSERLVISELRTLANAISSAFAQVEAEFTMEYGKTPVAAIIGRVIKEQVRRTLALLA